MTALNTINLNTIQNLTLQQFKDAYTGGGGFGSITAQAVVSLKAKKFNNQKICVPNKY